MFDTLERYRWLLVALLALPLLIAIGVLLGRRFNGPDPLVIEPGRLPPGQLAVYVTGAVNHPGVYTLTDGDRWIDAVAAAGGATSDADLANVNLAKRAADEDQVDVPRLGQPTRAVAGAVQSPGALVDLNTADATALEDAPRRRRNPRPEDHPVAHRRRPLHPGRRPRPPQTPPGLRLPGHRRARRRPLMALAYLALAWLLGVATAALTNGDWLAIAATTIAFAATTLALRLRNAVGMPRL